MKILAVLFCFQIALTYNDVVYVDSTSTQNELFVTAKNWALSTFKSTGGNIIQWEDKDAGIVIANGSCPIKAIANVPESRVDFSFKIEVKNGRYKYWIYEFEHVAKSRNLSGGFLCYDKPSCGTKVLDKKGWLQIKKQTEAAVKSLVQDLADQMCAITR